MLLRLLRRRPSTKRARRRVFIGRGQITARRRRRSGVPHELRCWRCKRQSRRGLRHGCDRRPLPTAAGVTSSLRGVLRALATTPARTVLQAGALRDLHFRVTGSGGVVRCEHRASGSDEEGGDQNRFRIRDEGFLRGAGLLSNWPGLLPPGPRRWHWACSSGSLCFLSEEPLGQALVHRVNGMNVRYCRHK